MLFGRVAQPHQMADLVSSRITTAPAEDGGIGGAVLFEGDVAASAIAAQTGPPAGAATGHRRPEHHHEIGPELHTQLFCEFAIHAAEFIVVVLHFRLRETHKAKPDPGSAGSVYFVCHGHHMPDVGVGIFIVVLGETAVVDRQHIDFHLAGRRLGIFGIRARQLLVEVAHAVAVCIGQVVQVPDVQPGLQRQCRRSAHEDAVLLDPTAALILVQKQLQAIFAGVSVPIVQLDRVALRLQSGIRRGVVFQRRNPNIDPREIRCRRDAYAQVAAVEGAEVPDSNGDRRARFGVLEPARTLQVDGLLRESANRQDAGAHRKPPVAARTVGDVPVNDGASATHGLVNSGRSMES